MSEGTLVKVKNLPTTTNVKNTDYFIVEQRAGTRKVTLFDFKRQMNLNVDSNEVLGGFHHVNTIAERDTIAEEKRKEGMLCHVLEENNIYQLIGGKENSNWVLSVFDYESNTIYIGDTAPADTSVVWVDNTDEHLEGITDNVLDNFRESIRGINDKVDDVEYIIKYNLDAGYFSSQAPEKSILDGDIGDIRSSKTGTVNKILIKRGFKSELKKLEVGELAFCIDTEELYIGGANKKPILISGIKQSEETGGGAIDNSVLIARLESDEGELELIDKQEVEENYEGLIINQVYGGGENNDTPVSHSFIELYNNSDRVISLNELSLQYAEESTFWKVLNLKGSINPYSSFLIRCNSCSDIDKYSTRFKIKRYDMTWNITLSDLGMKVYLCNRKLKSDYINPANIDGCWTKEEGYIDLFSVGGENDIDGYETEYSHILNKNTGARRLDFSSTFNNAKDIIPVDFNSVYTSVYMPHSSKDGEWDLYFNKKRLSNNIPNMINMCFGYEGDNTRTFTWQSMITDKGFIKYKKKDDSTYKIVESIREPINLQDTEATLHRIILKDLEEGSYIYRVGEEGRWSDEYEFTIHYPSNDDKITFLHIGDQKCDTEDKYDVWKKCINFISNNEEYDFIINTGDITNGRSYDFRYYYDYAKQYLSNTCHMMTCGDSDFSTNEVDNTQFTWYSTIENSKYPSVYSFNYGYTHFISLDSNIINNDSLERQIEWIRDDLSKEINQKRWIIVYLHKSPYTISRDEKLKELINVFYELKVDLVISGHSNCYCRSKRMGRLGLQDEDMTDNRGVYYINNQSTGYLKDLEEKYIDGSTWFELIHKEDYPSYILWNITYDNIEMKAYDILDIGNKDIRKEEFDTGFIIRK